MKIVTISQLYTVLCHLMKKLIIVNHVKVLIPVMKFKAELKYHGMSLTPMVIVISI